MLQKHWPSLVLLLLATACFKAPITSQGDVKLRKAKVALGALSTNLSETKSVATVDAQSKDATNVSVGEGNTLQGTNVSIPAGSLSISAEIIIEQAADFADTSLTSEVPPAANSFITQAGAGVIVRPSVEVVLTKPMTLSLPVPTSLNLAGASSYGVYFKYLDPESKQLVTGYKVVDGVDVRLAYNETTKADTIQLEGYFGAYWVVAFSREIAAEEVPVKKLSEEPIVNKANTAVVQKTGIVDEKQVLITQATAEFVWPKPVLSFQASARKVDLSANVAQNSGLKACKADFYESVSDLKGKQIDAGDKTTASFAIERLDAYTLIGRFRCTDSAGKISMSPWSDAAQILAYPRIKVESLTAETIDGLYGVDALISLVVRFSDKVRVEGNPTLSLKIGNQTRLATYRSGSESKDLKFQYKVALGDSGSALQLSGKDALSAGIADAGGVAIDLTLADSVRNAFNAGNHIALDGLNPELPTSIGFANPYGNTASISVSWSGGADANFESYEAKFCSQTNCTTSCGSTVTSTTASAILSANTNGSNYACVRSLDKAQNKSAWASSLLSYTLDTLSPTVVSVSASTANGIYGIGSAIAITVTFSEAVTTTGVAKLTLETGTIDRDAVYQSGSGTANLSFLYTVQAGDSSPDLNYVSTSALTGMIADLAGNVPDLMLPALASANSLSGNSSIVLDTTAPTNPSAVGFAGATSASPSFPVSWTSSTDANFKTHNIKLCTSNDCSTSCLSSLQSAASPATLTGVDGQTYYACVQGEDLAGNKSSFVSSLASLTVDASVPSILTMSSTKADGYYMAGITVPITVVFSETVIVTNGADITLTLETGALDASASYVSGSGSDTLLFHYIVGSGQNSSDLDAISVNLGAAGTIKDSGGSNANLALPASPALRLAGQKAIVIDTTAPTAASNVTGPMYPSSFTVPISWSPASDVNLGDYYVKLCLDSACSAGCTASELAPAPPKTMTGNQGLSYYACVKSSDRAENYSSYISSPFTINFPNTPIFSGAVSAETVGSEGRFAIVELTLGSAPQFVTGLSYDVFFSTSPDPNSFINPPVSTGNAFGDFELDYIPTDNKIRFKIDASQLADGYWRVKFVDPSGLFTDTNTQVTSLYNVLKGTPNFVLIPKAQSGLSYDYYIMQYEASLSASGTNNGGDVVTTTDSNAASCGANFTAGNTSSLACGTKIITKSAESTPTGIPANTVSWDTAFFACRNASSASANVRLPTEEEWRRASEWKAPDFGAMMNALKGSTNLDCNVGLGTALHASGARPNCRSRYGVYDMAGNLSEWVDKRLIDYGISGNGESRFGYGPTIGVTIKNGLDGLSQRYHNISSVYGLALTMGANNEYAIGADRKAYGADVQSWRASAATSPSIGFRCVGFATNALPTSEQIALPQPPTYVAADVTAKKVPENFYVKDVIPETVKIIVDGSNPSVPEGSIRLEWSPWKKAICTTGGSCPLSENVGSYNVYRFREPNQFSNQLPITWALPGINSNWGGSGPGKPLDPLAKDPNGNFFYTSSTSDGRIVYTTGGCSTGNPSACSFTDSVSAGTDFDPSAHYIYLLFVTDSVGNGVVPMVQRYRSSFLTGSDAFGASFRMEPRYRRASVALVDKDYQMSLPVPQVMVHVPMDKSGLDHDFYIGKYESSLASGSYFNSVESSAWPLQSTSGTWLSAAANCEETKNRTLELDVNFCGNGSTVNPTSAIVQHKPAVTVTSTGVDQGAAKSACYNTIIKDGPFEHTLRLPTGAEWFKAADWGDLDWDGTIDESDFYPANLGVSVASLEQGTADGTTVRCHTDLNPASPYNSESAQTTKCISRYGARDMVGNVAEWVLDQSFGPHFTDNGLDGFAYSMTPSTGLVSLGGGQGVDPLSGTGIAGGAAGEMNMDIWNFTALSSVQGQVRGGTNSSNQGAGRFDAKSVDASSTTELIGFRCVY